MDRRPGTDGPAERHTLSPMTAPHLWIRAEARPTEQRVPLVPADAARLVEDGFVVTVEESPTRIVAIDDYVAAGCSVAPYGLSLIHI